MYVVEKRSGNETIRLRHTCENNMAEGASEMASETTVEEPFKTVPTKRKRKRGQLEDMDTSEESQRPSFPPAKAEKLMVTNILLSAHKLQGMNRVSLFQFSSRLIALLCRMERQSPEKYLYPHTDTRLLKKTG